MKIKAASAATGLTERTIRFYTEKGLLSPQTEERNGRYFHDYGEEDLLSLRNSAILRRAGFSIEEILTMRQEPERIPEIVCRRKQTICRETECLAVLSQALEAIEDDCPTDAWKLAECLEAAGKKLPEPDFSRFDPESQAEKDEAYAIFKGRRLLREQRQERLRPVKRAAVILALVCGVFLGAFFLSGLPKRISISAPCCAFSLSGDGVIAETELVVEGNLYRQWFSTPSFQGTIQVEGWSDPKAETVDLVFDQGLSGSALLVYSSIVQEQGEAVPKLDSSASVWLAADGAYVVLQWFVPVEKGGTKQPTDLVLCAPATSRAEGVAVLDTAGITEVLRQYPAYEGTSAAPLPD